MAALAARRHALNLPAGSIRAAHVLGVVGLVCAIILIPPRDPDHPVAIPPYLIYLTFLIVGHFFAAHGKSIATRDDPAPSPLYLPGGLVRILVVLALAGSIGWKLYADAEGLQAQYEASLDELKNQPYMPLVILCGFIVGIVVHAIGVRESLPAWQDFEAWVSVLALVGIGIAAVIHLFVQPTTDSEVVKSMPLWESILGGLVAFYFGARS